MGAADADHGGARRGWAAHPRRDPPHHAQVGGGEGGRERGREKGAGREGGGPGGKEGDWEGRRVLASKAGVMKKVMQLMHRWVGGGGDQADSVCVCGGGCTRVR